MYNQKAWDDKWFSNREFKEWFEKTVIIINSCYDLDEKYNNKDDLILMTYFIIVLIF